MLWNHFTRCSANSTGYLARHVALVFDFGVAGRTSLTGELEGRGEVAKGCERGHSPLALAVYSQGGPVFFLTATQGS